MKYTGSLPRGKEFRILEETTTGAGVSNEQIGIDADSVLVSLFVTAITGTLTVRVYTQTDTGQEKLILTMPVQSAPTPELVINRAGPSMDRLRVEATYTGVCNYSIRVRGSEAADTDSGAGNNSDLIVTSPTLQNITMAVAGTEYSVVIPVGAKRFSVYSRQDSVLQATYTSGQSGLNYFTIGYGVWYTEENLAGSSLTLYIQSTKNNTVLEVLSWQ
jgi:hypothetical protein